MMLTQRIALFIALVLTLVSCGTPRIRTANREGQKDVQPRPAPPPKTNVPKIAPEKLFETGRKFFDAKDYNKSYDYYMAAASGWSGQPRELEAQVWAARSLIRGTRYHDTVDLTNQLLTKKWTDPVASELTGYRIRSLEAIGDYFGALNAAVAAYSNPQLSKETESYRLKINDMIDTKLSVAELEKVADSETYGNFRGGALFRLGELSMDAKDTSGARAYFAKVTSVAPQSEWAPRAQDLLNQLEAVRRVEPKTVGVVLPMTGRHAPIAQKTLRGIQMGLGLYNNYPSTFKLAVVDSEGNPDNARRGVERLVKEDNVISVIGSVLSRTAPAVASKTAELGVPSIALSQKSGITDIGGTVFRNSLTSEMQVRYLVKTAMEDLGMKNFVILFPNDLYGVEFANIFWDEVSARGGQIVGAQTYSNKETDFRDQVQRLVGTYYVEARADEYRLRLKEWTDAQTRKSARNTPPGDLLPPIVDFDGIFIPDSAKAMGQISAMLSFNGVKNIRLLGTNIWNVPGIAKRAGHFSNNLLFVDSFVGTEPRFASSTFVKDYKAIFGEDPGIFEIQGYDAALLLRQLISQGYTSRETLASALARVRDFPGAVGPLSMTTEREVMRPLVALTLDGSANVVPMTATKKP